MKKPIAIIVIFTLLVGGIIGWLVRGDQADNAAKPVQPATPSSSQTQGVGNKAASSEVKSLVNYSLPDSWQEATCDDKTNTVYVLPPQVTLNCTVNPSAPINISVDPQGVTDCNQLDDEQNVRKHTCKSTNIDGKKSLQASTEYTQSANRKAGETISGYYIDTGKGVVKVEYHFSGENLYQTEYDQIARSVNLK